MHSGATKDGEPRLPALQVRELAPFAHTRSMGASGTIVRHASLSLSGLRTTISPTEICLAPNPSWGLRLDVRQAAFLSQGQQTAAARARTRSSDRTLCCSSSRNAQAARLAPDGPSVALAAGRYPLGDDSIMKMSNLRFL